MMGISPEGVVVRFFGIFFFSFQSSLIWGNLISSVVLSAGGGGPGLEPNGTILSEMLIKDVDTSVCGSAFCPSYASQDEVIVKPPVTQIHILSGIYLALNFVALALVALFLDPLSR